MVRIGPARSGPSEEERLRLPPATRRPRRRRRRPRSSGPHPPRPRPATTNPRLIPRPSPPRTRSRRRSSGCGRSRPLPRPGNSRAALMPATNRGGCRPSRSLLPMPRPSWACSGPMRSGWAGRLPGPLPQRRVGGHSVSGPARPPQQRRLGRDSGRDPVGLAVPPGLPFQDDARFPAAPDDGPGAHTGGHRGSASALNGALFGRLRGPSIRGCAPLPRGGRRGR